MGYEMRNLRKEDTSLYMYIKNVVLSDFIEHEENVSLDYISEISTANSYVYEIDTTIIPSPKERGRGWVYIDNSYDVREQSSRVTVYDALGVPINESQYILDYMDCRVVTSGTCNPDNVSYYWNYVSLVDEWSAVESSDPPVVVIDVQGTNKFGYQLGSGKRVVRKVSLYVFASDPAERNDLIETLYDGVYLKSCPLYDFPKGTMLDYDGTWFGRRSNMDKDDATTFFNDTTVSGVIGNLEFENVVARHVNLPLLMTRGRDEVMLSDINAYRSTITFDLVSYTRDWG